MPLKEALLSMSEKLTLEKVKETIQGSGYKKSLINKLKLSSELNGFLEFELVPIFDNKGHGLVLLKGNANDGYKVLRFESSALKADTKTGRYKPVICDLCFTWKRGSTISRTNFSSSNKDSKKVGLLCCSKLNCSLHVRSLTEDAKLSRAQLKEDLDDNERVIRLKKRYIKLLIDELRV